MTAGHIRILTISIACVLCACFVDSASAQPQAAPNYYFCFSHPTADTAYFSGVFVVDYSIDGDARAWAAAGERERRDRNSPSPGPAPWVQQFDQFVAQTYPRTAKGAGACNSYGTLAETQKRLDNDIQSEQNNHTYNNKYKVAETGWKYPPAASAPAPPAPAASRPADDPCAFSGVGLATAPPAGCGPAGRAVSPTPPAAPVASARVNPPPPPQNPQVQNTSPAGTVVVRIIHPIDSSQDPVGTQYKVTVVPGNRSIPPGSSATVMLTKAAGGGLTLQLISIYTAGRTVAVTGGSAAIAATTVRTPALLSRMSASGASVFVPTSTTLSFVLGATP